jgi:hypothetical protein
MAATWNRYAAGVLVAAGIAITGTMFWERGAALRGEDVAEMNAEIHKRTMWSRLTGDQTPTNLPWQSQLCDIEIGHGLAWKALYGNAVGSGPYPVNTSIRPFHWWYGMNGARALALLDAAGAPLWLDASKPAPADGDVIADCNSFFYMHSAQEKTNVCGNTYTEEYWKLTASNHVDKLATAAGRSGNNKTWPRVASSNAPLSRRWFGVTNALSEHDWWETIGNGTTNYIFACEKKPCVVLDKVYGGPCEIVTNEIDIASAGDSATVHIQMPESNNYPRATVWKTRHRKGEDGDGEEQHLVVETGAWNPLKEIYTTIPLYTLAEGSWTRLEFYTRTHPNDMPEGVTNTIDFDIVYSSGNLRATPYPDHPIWFKQYKGHPRGDTRMIYVTATNDNDTADSVIVWRVGYLGQTYEYIIYCPDTKPATTHDLRFSSAAIQSWTGTPNPAETTTLTLDKDTAVWPPQTGRATAKKNLSQAYNIITNLNRSVMFFAPNAVTYDPTNSVKWYGYGYDASNTTVQMSAKLSEVWSEAVGSPEAYGISATLPAGNVAVCGGWADVSFSKNEGDGGSAGYYSDKLWNASASVEWYDLKDCCLPWPCAAAYETGAVARVEVFAALVPALPFNSPPHPFYDHASWLPCEGASSRRFSYTGPTLAPAYGLLSWARLPEIEYKAASASYTKTVRIEHGARATVPLRLTSVAEESNPSSNVVFNLDFRPGSLDVSGAEFCSRGYTIVDVVDEDGENWWYSLDYEDLDASPFICLAGWVVVVDWNWDFDKTAEPPE